MPDPTENTQTGVEDPQAAAGSAQDVQAQTGEEQQAVAGQEQKPQEQMVPLSALEAERAKRQQMELILANSAQPQSPVQTPQQADVLGQMGLTADDLYDPQKLATGVQGLVNRQVQQAVSQITISQFTSSHPDYAQVVGQSYGNQFVPSAQFQQACQEDPTLGLAVQGLLNGGNTLAAMQLAYDRASAVSKKPTTQPQQQIPGAPQNNPDVQARIGPMSPASVGGAGGAFATAQKVGQMSEDEFARMDAEAAGTPA